MPSPIIAYHVAFSAYGFWLPNDPRGSWSREVWAPHLAPFGPVVPAATRRSLAAAPHDVSLRRQAQAHLLRPPVRFNDAQVLCMGDALGREAARCALPLFALALMPDHAHLVFPCRGQTAEGWVGYFKRAASRALRQTGLHPCADQADAQGRLPSLWAEGGWRVYLHSPQDVLRSIRYVHDNPIRAGLPPNRGRS